MAESGTPRGRGRPRTGVRESILAAAQQVLDEVGGRGLTTRSVAVRAQVAESSVFYHFGDRAGLLDAIILIHVGDYHRLVDERVTTGRSDRMADELEAMLGTLEDFYVRILPIMAAIQSDPESARGYAARSADRDLGPHRALPPVLRLLRSMQESGWFDPAVDPATAGLFLIGAAFQRALVRRFGGPLESLPAPAAVAADLVVLLRSGSAG